MKPPARYQVPNEWIQQTLTPVELNFAPSAPGNRYWYGCLLAALGHEYVKEGFTLLDYGCGNAALAVFITGKLSKFEYFGLEPEGSPHIHSAVSHPNIHVGYIGSPVEDIAIGQANCVILGSVFTHLEWKDSCAILDKIQPIIRRGAVVFSCFIADAEAYIDNNHYPYSSIPTYHYAFITEDMIKKYAELNKFNFEITDIFYSLGDRNGIEVIHRFVKLTA